MILYSCKKHGCLILIYLSCQKLTDFYGKGVSSMNLSTRIGSGSPFGGVAVLWHKSLGKKCKPILYGSDTQLMGLELSNNCINYQENHEEFVRYLTVIDSLVMSSYV